MDLYVDCVTIDSLHNCYKINDFENIMFELVIASS